VNNSDLAVGYGEGFDWQNADIADNLQLWDIAVATIFGFWWAIALIVW